MAKYTIVPTCGHKFEVALFGAHAARQARIEWLEERVCPDCWKAEQAKAAARKNAAANLQALEGSEKQITWAEQIRAKAVESLSAIREKLDKQVAHARMAIEIIDATLSNTNAGAWIDCRNESFGESWLRYRIRRRKKAESTVADD